MKCIPCSIFNSYHFSIMSEQHKKSKQDEENTNDQEGTPLLSDQYKVHVSHKEGMQ